MKRAAAGQLTAQRIGRFTLRQVLGRGAQAVVWQAHDERLDRDVALKLLQPGADTLAVSQWLHEARAVSRLTHPNIVPVFEADEHDGQPYLVFELVRGRTLSEALRGGKPMAARDAVNLMAGVLDALQAAHDEGIVHRDLKPSNVLVDATGRGRVMDFGIAARVGADNGDGHVVGTPGYISPEAARGAAPAPAMDVFAAGMMLGEMLAGVPLLRERDPYRALHRVQHEDMSLPDTVRIDDSLRASVLRAIARDPALRFASAAAMRDALNAWAQPTSAQGSAAAASAAAATPGGSSGTLEFLLRRMRSRSDFPALSDSIARIQRMASSDNENLNSLAGEILKDIALTNKLLRLVNSAHYSPAGGGSISTVSRAVALVGFAGIRNMALSLVLLEHMHDKAHAARLREEFLRALMAGQLASELARSSRESEEAFLGGMLHNLGRLLTEFYFPDEAKDIRDLLRPSGRDYLPMTPAHASARVLGIAFDELGVSVARSWGLPESLQQCMRSVAGEPPARRAESVAERLRWLAGAANEATDSVMSGDDAALGVRLQAIGARHAKVLGIADTELARAVDTARQKLTQLAAAMGLQVSPQSAAQRLLAKVPTPPAPARDELAAHALAATVVLASATGVVEPDLLLPDAATLVPPRAGAASGADDRTLVLPKDSAPAPAAAPAHMAELLAAGIQDITDTMAADSFKLNEVLRMILETMYRALGFRRVLLCLRDASSDTLAGRVGLGEGVEAVAAAFKVPLKNGADLFTVVCRKNADTLIADSRAANIASRLPQWYVRAIGAPSFLLLPLAMKGAPFGLIYADKAEPGAIALGEKELSLLRTLRNQAVMAFRQAA